MFKRYYTQFILLITFFCVIIFISGGIAAAKKKQPQGTVHDIYPSMPRGYIQAVVDSASKGDTIYFHAGIYDWRSTPLAERAENIGAINIIEKTLTIKGEEGAVLLGPVSVDGAGDGARGVTAFHVKDLDTNNDVTFDGLTFQTFLRGVSSGYTANYPVEPDISVPNLRNLTVKNCVFSDIHRDAISISYIGGNVLIQNNDMQADRMGLFLSWYWSEGHMAWQPEDTYIRFLDNIVTSQRLGLYFLQTTNVIVKQNSIESELTGIWMGYTRKGAVISGNSFFNCNYGISIYGRLRVGVEFEAEGVVVEKNGFFGTRDIGIRLIGDACYGHTVSKNEIQMVPGSSIGIYTLANDSYYGQNKISGSGWIAFMLDWWNYGGFIVYAHHETLQANNVNQFLPDFSHFYLADGTHDNLIVGSGMGHNTYIDDGYNNRITGAMPMAGGIGQDLSDAVKERNEKLKEAGKIKF